MIQKSIQGVEGGGIIPPDCRKRSTDHFPTTCLPDLFSDQIWFRAGSSSTFSSLFLCLVVYLTSGGGALLLFIGIDCESPMRFINNCVVLRCLSDSVFLQDLQTLTPDLAIQAPCSTAVISPPQIPTKDTPIHIGPKIFTKK